MDQGDFAPTANNLCGRRNYFRSHRMHEIRYKTDQYASVKLLSFSIRMHQNRLAMGLCPDPLGELTALPQTL